MQSLRQHFKALPPLPFTVFWDITYDFIVPPREVQPASKAAFELDQCSKGSCGHWDQMMVATWSWGCGLLWLEMWYFVPLHYQFQCSGIVLGRSCGEQCKCC